jgi:hypothetical protein
MSKKFTELYESIMNDNSIYVTTSDKKQVLVNESVLSQLKELGCLEEGLFGLGKSTSLSADAIKQLQDFVAQDPSRKTPKRFETFIAHDKNIISLVNNLKSEKYEEKREKILNSNGIKPESDLGKFLLKYAGIAIKSMEGNELVAHKIR